MRRFTLDQLVKRANYPTAGRDDTPRDDCGWCGWSTPDEFGNRDFLPHRDCPWHGGNA